MAITRASSHQNEVSRHLELKTTNKRAGSDDEKHIYESQYTFPEKSWGRVPSRPDEVSRLHIAMLNVLARSCTIPHLLS